MRKSVIYYFLFLFFLLSIFASGVIDSQDGFQYLAVARNIYYKGEPTAPSPEDYYKGKNIHMSTEIAANGKPYSPTGLGFSLAMIPAVALTDIFYKIYHVSPPVYFPLEADWLILMTANFTNCFFAAGLGIIFFLYFLTLGLNKKQSFLMSFISIFTTNLFAYSKHIFAHMMFITLLGGSFLAIKYYSLTKKRVYLVISGLAYGLMIITYNQSFIFTLPSYLIYYFMLNNSKIDLKKIKQSLFNGVFVLIGIIPFSYLYSWYNAIRDGAGDPPTNLTNFVTNNVSYLASYLKIGVLFEGL